MVETLIRAAWRYRGFVMSSIANDFRARLARSRLGTAWVVLQPLAQALIYATVLSSVLASRLQGIDNRFAYAVYLLAGILCWSLFVEIVTRCLSVFIENGSLLKKMQFPRISLPLVVIGSSLVNNVALLAVLLVLLPILGFYPTLLWVWIPLLIALTVALATGLGLLLGTLNVFARDIGQVMVVVLQFWFWVTPIVYPLNVLPEQFKALLLVNPVAPLVMAYHDVIVYQRAPGTELWFPAIAAALFLALAFMVFRRASAEMVDAL
jgi:lipopolysaccharide transport system permease protein